MFNREGLLESRNRFVTAFIFSQKTLNLLHGKTNF